MSAPNYSNSTVGMPKKVGGAVFTAPYGTALPTSATATLNTAFTCVGAISEDGVKTTRKMDSKKHRVWGGDVALVTNKNYDEVLTYALAEICEDGEKVAWGAGHVTTSSGLAVIHDGFNPAKVSIVVDSILSNGKAMREVYACCILTGVGDEVLDGETLVTCELEFGMVRDDTLGGYSARYVEE